MKNTVITLLLLVALAGFTGSSQAEDSAPAGEIVPGIPVKNTVTLVDLGAKTCIPCKMMAPILEELKKEYEGKAAVIFIDVWQDPAKGKDFKVSTIPTQIFFDKNGKETFRHTGFFDKKSMKEILDKML